MRDALRKKKQNKIENDAFFFCSLKNQMFEVTKRLFASHCEIKQTTRKKRQLDKNVTPFISNHVQQIIACSLRQIKRFTCRTINDTKRLYSN